MKKLKSLRKKINICDWQFLLTITAILALGVSYFINFPYEAIIIGAIIRIFLFLFGIIILIEVIRWYQLGIIRFWDMNDVKYSHDIFGIIRFYFFIGMYLIMAAVLILMSIFINFNKFFK